VGTLAAPLFPAKATVAAKAADVGFKLTVPIFTVPFV
jgi:hypothetical protein